MCLFECGVTGRYYKSNKLGVIKKKTTTTTTTVTSRAAERHNTQDKATVGAVSYTMPVVY